MFYLNLLLKHWLKNPFKFFLFSVFGVLSTIMAAQYKNFEMKLIEFYRVEVPGPSFQALISSKQNASWIARKLLELPGVKSVEQVEEKELGAGLMASMGELAQSLPQEAIKFDYNGLKVTFLAGLSTPSQNLIRDYLIRLGQSEGEIILGKIKSHEKFASLLRMPIEKTQKLILPLVVTLIGVFWFIIFYSYNKPIREAAYIVEKFQRRRWVATKAMFFQQCLIVLISLVIILNLKNTDLVSFGVVAFALLASSFFNLRKYEWPEG